MLIKVLPEFQKFLTDNSMVPESKISYCAYWVSTFLVFSNNNQHIEISERIKKYLSYLENEKKVPEWQIKQAHLAIHYYINKFMKKNSSVLFSDFNEKNGQFNTEVSSILNSLRQMIRIKHYSYKTERSYIDWVIRLLKYIKDKKSKDISSIDSSDVKDFLSFLAVERNVSASTQNQAFNAILFLFRDILKIDIGDLDKTVRAKRGPRLPVVLTVDEVREMFKHAKGQSLLILQLLYGTGMRLMEISRLRIQDIDFGSNLIFIRSSKGDKDRTTMLPERVKGLLKEQIEKVQGIHQQDIQKGYGEVYLPDAVSRKYPHAGKEFRWQYVFPAAYLSTDPRSGVIRRHHISEKAVQNAVREAVLKTGINKHVTVHTLRHSFATHLLQDGVNIREIQELLGHKHVETTMIYTHVLRDITKVPRSPLDMLLVKV